MSYDEVPCLCGVVDDECPVHPKPVEVPAEFKARLAELSAELERKKGTTMSGQSEWGECACVEAFGQLYWQGCPVHERCPAQMDGIPIQCILAAGHTGRHK